jgi:hypothetical protein
MKLISLVKCCRWKHEIDIIGQNAAGGNMKMDIIGRMLQEET